jgi:hypothetical protein
MGLTKKTIGGALLVVEGLGAVVLGVAGLFVNGWWVNEGLVNVDTYPWWTTAAKTLAVWLAPIASFRASRGLRTAGSSARHWVES